TTEHNYYTHHLHLSERTPTPPRYTLFPYTTLFRSHPREGDHPRPSGHQLHASRASDDLADPGDLLARSAEDPGRCLRRDRRWRRSEEHTSELQSRENLVCRLLLEKKNTNRPSLTWS